MNTSLQQQKWWIHFSNIKKKCEKYDFTKFRVSPINIPNITFCWCVVDDLLVRTWVQESLIMWLLFKWVTMFLWDFNTNQHILRRQFKHFVRLRRRERIQQQECHLNHMTFAEFKIRALTYICLKYICSQLFKCIGIF